MSMMFADADRIWLWPQHCLRMADATRVIADLCDDPDMRTRYLQLAERWEAKVSEGPSLLPEERRSVLQ